MPWRAASHLFSSIISHGYSASRSPASKCSASSLTIAWTSAARPSVCPTRVCESIARISTVPKFGCGRTSYQRYV